jgi:hypothetical protein
VDGGPGEGPAAPGAGDPRPPDNLRGLPCPVPDQAESAFLKANLRSQKTGMGYASEPKDGLAGADAAAGGDRSPRGKTQHYGQPVPQRHRYDDAQRDRHQLSAWRARCDTNITSGYARLNVSTLLGATVHAWCRRDAVVALVSRRRCEAPLRRDRAIGTSAKPTTTAQLPAAGATAMGAAPFARSYSRTSITHSPLLCRQQCLPVIGPRASGTALHVWETERSLARSSVDSPKSGHLRGTITKRLVTVVD